SAFSRWSSKILDSSTRSKFFCTEASAHLLNADKFNLDCYIYPSSSTSTEVKIKIPIAKAVSAAAVPITYITDFGIANKVYTQRVQFSTIRPNCIDDVWECEYYHYVYHFDTSSTS
ncbi:MAG: hypothetical protein QF535_19985, partial [Anaerolineales bacterium]|nr:hypothetical protein [Anaerolineales bacterium]